MQELEQLDLGRASYDDALLEQRRCVESTRADGRTRAILVEHDPAVITLGRRGAAGDVLANLQALAAAEIELRTVSRGGEVTWHGPGQLVAYVIRRLGRKGRSVHGHVRLLEDAIIDTLQHFGIDAGRQDGLVGVWVDGRKIAAVGVAVERWIAWHGLAVSVDCDLSAYDLIIPCGDRNARPTSMAETLARAITVDDVRPVLAKCLTDRLSGGVASRAADRHDEGAPPVAMPDGPRHATRARLPAWLKKPIPAGGRKVRRLLDELGLATVCSSARCPNQAECFARKTATFMILGTSCTRNCRFCAVDSGAPQVVRPGEPEAVAEAAERLGLRHVVITSVTRDDLPDGGAAHFARTILAVRDRLPEATVEVLLPDFGGDAAAIDTVLDARPDVFNHNVETVERLQAAVRPQADYRRSLAVLARAAARDDGAVKSGLMVGLGETHEEVIATMQDLRAAGCGALTIGQYLAPSDAHLPVERFVEPTEFDAWRTAGADMGFAAVAAGPFVRSSYRADQLFDTCDR